MNKKALIILSGIFVLIIAALAYLVFVKYYPKTGAPNSVSPQPFPQNAQKVSGNSPESPAPSDKGRGFVKLSDGPVISPISSYDGKSVAYAGADGAFYKADLSASNTALSLFNVRVLDIPPETGIKKILWPAQGGDFLVLLNNGRYAYFNHTANSFVNLPPQVTAADWMPAGDKIIYSWLKDGKADLQIANPDLTGWQDLGAMYAVDNSLSVSPDGLNVLFFRTGNTDIVNTLNLATPDGKVWRTLVKDGFNFGVLWSPDGKKFLFGRKNFSSGSFELWVYDILTAQARDLKLAASPDKAAWDSQGTFVYAAAASAGSASDSFVKVDVATLQQKQYLPPPAGVSISASDLFLNLNQDKLFFKNLNDGALYYLNLNQ